MSRRAAVAQVESCPRGHPAPEDVRDKRRGCRECARIRDRRYHEGERLQLPAGPFVDWLRERVPEEGLTEWGERHGINGSHVRHLLNRRQETIHIDVVDRVAVAMGDPGLLNDLYPLED